MPVSAANEGVSRTSFGAGVIRSKQHSGTTVLYVLVYLSPVTMIALCPSLLQRLHAWVVSVGLPLFTRIDTVTDGSNRNHSPVVGQAGVDITSQATPASGWRKDPGTNVRIMWSIERITAQSAASILRKSNFALEFDGLSGKEHRLICVGRFGGERQCNEFGQRYEYTRSYNRLLVL
jgi:hypothetical protein